MRKTRNENTCHGIIGKVYYTFKGELWTSQTSFYQLLGMSFQTAESFCKNTNHSKTIDFDFFNAETNDYFINNLKDNIEKNLNISKNDSAKYNQKLLDILSQDNHYLKQSLGNIRPNEVDRLEDRQYEYDKEYTERLSNYIRIYNASVNFAHNLYLIMVLAFTKKLPRELFFGAIYESQIHEFNEKVSKLYGMSSRPATRAILELAESRNIIAQYERAEKYYYGDTISNIPRNIPLAYKLYKDVAGLNLDSDLPEKKNAENIHPLALWSLGYILFNYHRNNSELANCASISEIDYWLESKGLLFVVEKALQYTLFSFDLIENAPSANILGKIALLSEDNLPGITAIKEKYKMKEAPEYFKCAADKGYVYAINNEAVYYSNKIFEDPKNKVTYAQKYVETLSKSAQKYEPWACNELGHFFRTGIIEERILYSMQRTGNTDKLEEFISTEKSQMYYLRASEIILDKTSGWSCYNMLLFYKEWVLKNNKLEEMVYKINLIGDPDILKKTHELLKTFDNKDLPSCHLDLIEDTGKNDEEYRFQTTPGKRR